MSFLRGPSARVPAPAAPQRPIRRSSGMAEISRLLNSEEPLCVVDLGSTSANNIRFLTAKGHKNYSEDLLQASLDPVILAKNDEGKLVPDEQKFLKENPPYPTRLFHLQLFYHFLQP